MISLLPRDEKFYDEIEQLGTSAADASKELLEVTRTFPGSDDVREKIQRWRLAHREDNGFAHQSAPSSYRRLFRRVRGRNDNWISDFRARSHFNHSRNRWKRCRPSERHAGCTPFAGNGAIESSE
jgi:hypothetical protein